MYISTKTYNHSIGLSACFRQWRAQSHCRFLHGYALAVRLEFAADDDALDLCNWVVDFGSLKSLKQRLEDTFDHKLLVAEDDPHLPILQELDKLGLAQVVIVPRTGCEAFARLIFETTEIWLRDAGYAPRVRMHKAEVSEHGANSAIYQPGDPYGGITYSGDAIRQLRIDEIFAGPSLEVGDA